MNHYRSLPLFLLLFILFLPFLSSASVELTVFRPLSLRARFPAGHIAANPALFGVPSFISPYIGQLFTTEPKTACTPLSHDSLRPTFSSSRDGSLPFILLIDRGGCSFTTKVRNAERIGAIAVIVINSDNTDPSLIFMSDDGTGRELKTPSVIIKRLDGDTLRNAVMASNTTGQGVINQVVMEMRWILPRADNIVTAELWSSSFEYSSRNLRDAFSTIINAFGGNILFRPRYRIWTPRSLMCDISGLNECDNACTNNKRYCAPDPDLPMVGLNGKNVIEEDLRQLCLYRLLNQTKNATNIAAGLIYQSSFLGECANAASYSDACAYNIIDRLEKSGIQISSNAVKKCINDSGGTTSSNINTILEEEQKRMTEIGVYFTPMLYLNDVAYYGSMSCPLPVDIASCNPLKAICSAYKIGAEPRACHTPAGCELGKLRDACGVCGGDGAIDQCGLCLSKSSPHFSQSCKGCDGIPNSGKIIDYCGVCGGDAKGGPCLTSGQIAGIVIGCLIISGILAFVAYSLFRRYQNRMRADVDRLLRQYLPLQEGDTIHNDHHHEKNNRRTPLTPPLPNDDNNLQNKTKGPTSTTSTSSERLIDDREFAHAMPASSRTYFAKNNTEDALDPDNQL